MSLLELYKTNKAAFESYHIRQVVGIAGDGKLRDKSVTSADLREFISLQDSDQLVRYVEQCLADKFDQSGFVLQDLVNELGRRLDFEVRNGLYQGRKDTSGHDGLWMSPDGHTLIVEVKSTDTYRINLDTIAGYRRKLLENELVRQQSSMLIVVGREETGDLEAQVRGSRHAWDVRIISAEALAKLVKLKQEGDEETATRVRSLLIPREFTRLDELIVTMFLTAEDVRRAPEEGRERGAADDASAEVSETSSQERTDPETLEALRNTCVERHSEILGVRLLKRSKAQYWSNDRNYRACCTLSKYYQGHSNYWYAYHDKWHAFLKEGQSGFLLLGCVDENIAFAIPADTMEELSGSLNVSSANSGGKYWHIHVASTSDGKHVLRLKGRGNIVEIDKFRYSLK